MKLHALPVALAFGVIATSALKIPFQQAKRSSSQSRSGGAAVSVSRPGAALSNVNVLAVSDETNAFDVNSVHDLIYLANITLGGNEYPVQLDTGSSDLWIKGPSTPLPNANQTSTTQNLTYGIGWAYGHISYAPAQFAGISVPSQAYLDVSSAVNPALSYGADGILGLGFTSLSTIDAIVNRTSSSAGRSLLYNLFMDNPSEPNFIAFSLERNSDSTDNADGLFSVGEYDPKYQDIVNTNPIPTFPQNSPSRWTILVESLIIGQNQISLKTAIASAPSNKAVALLDSGTSYTYAPAEVCNAIYGGVQGAHYDFNQGQWIVPCQAEIDMALQINNEIYPIHPLDVTPQGVTDPTTCVGSFVPQAVAVGQGEFDWLIGDNVLRSVYSIYDFGDFDSSGHMGDPYVKLLSIVDPNTASADFHKLRGGTPLTNITYNAANSTTGSTSVSVSDDVAQVLAKIGMFFPTMLAVMAFNALILLVLVIVGIVILCKRRGPKTSRKTRGRMSPVPLNRTRFSGASRTEPTHAYQPVSMALTEDTFVPPMPAFRGDTMRSKNRPKSSFSSISVSSPASPSMDLPFTPMSPSFGDRPQSSFLPSPIRPQSFMPQANRPQSSYTPTSTIPSQNSAPSTVPDISEDQMEDDITHSSPSEIPVFPEESPFVSQSPPSRSVVELGDVTPPASPEPHLFVPPSPSFRNSVQAGDRPRSYAPPASPDQTIPLPPSPTLKGNMQSGDRPRSYAPPASPEQALFAPPSPTFRSSVQSGDRPRSFAPPTPSEQALFVPPSPPFRRSVQAGDRPRSNAPSSGPLEQTLSVPPSPSFRSNVQPGDRPRSYAPPPMSPEDDLFTPPSPAFRGGGGGGDRPRSMA